jgi:single-stranded-DNA-specific exonuclease
MTGQAAEAISTDKPIVSLSGRHWRLRPGNDRLMQQIMQQAGLEPVVAQILAARGFTIDQIPSYLQPKMRDLMPDPFSFKDMDKAVARILQAIEAREKVAVFGDYDVDGATSSALMMRFLRFVGLEPTLYIPDRVTEGYGPNVKAFQMLHESGHTLIITLDCGVVAFEPMKYASDNKLDVVILDHHMAAPELPPAVAIVNPNRLDESGGFRYLAACGVTFMTLVALSQKLRDKNIELPNLIDYLDLVALGTVCDVVPLIDLNRAFVSQGLKIMAGRKNTGLRALCDRANLEGRPTAYHAGFVLGPRINAGGRISVSQLGATLLSTEDANTAIEISEELEQLNRERQELEKRSVEEAIGIVARDDSAFTHAIVLASRDWHPGVIGLIASRLKEQYQRPTCIIALDENGKGKASGRSITGVDLGALVLKARMEGLILEGGGHAMAAGFSLHDHQIPALLKFFTDELTKQYGPMLPPPEIAIDATLAMKGVNLNVVKQLEQMEPFGANNSSPKLMLSPVRLERIDIVKEKHLRLHLTDDSNLQRLDVMYFGAANGPVHRDLLKIGPQQRIALVGSLKNNSWQGRDKAQFIADDIALVG